MLKSAYNLFIFFIIFEFWLYKNEFEDNCKEL